MQAWTLDREPGIERLALTELPRPRPDLDQVVIRVRAASVNYHDVMVVTGTAPSPLPRPFVPLSDAAGEVVEVGARVTRVRVGDRVVGAFLQRWRSGRPPADVGLSIPGATRPGVLAEYAVLDAEGVLPIPDPLSFEEAATLPVAGVTSWSALHEGDPLRPGDTVLVQGTGGVAMFALQLAAAAGARVIVISSSEAKLARAREHGAHATINYVETPAWDERARELTGGAGVDLVVDVAGGDLSRTLGALRIGGQASLVGLLGGAAARFDLVPVFQRNLRLRGISVGSREAFEALLRAIAHHGLRPVIDRVVPFAEAPAALAALAAGGSYVGKLVIRGAP